MVDDLRIVPDGTEVEQDDGDGDDETVTSGNVPGDLRYANDEPISGGGRPSGTNPNEQLGFEIDSLESFWSFAPEFYPSDFTQSKETELKRYGGDCNGESVSIKTLKNREVHVTGLLLENELGAFNLLMDSKNPVDLISPLTPNRGGMECHVKQAELGNEQGWDPHTRQRVFEYKVDLVSTGKDEYGSRTNDIVSAITSAGQRSRESGPLS